MTSILGLYPTAFLAILAGVLLVGLIILWFWYNARQRKKHQEMARGKLWCEFCSPEGAFHEMCDVWKGMVKKKETQRGSFVSDHWVQAPKGYEEFSDIYLVFQDHCFPVRWPEGKPFNQQITVMETHYVLGDPIPQITYAADKWDTDRYTRVTAAIMKYAQDERVMQVAISAIGDIERRLQNLVNYLKVIPRLQLILLILGLLILGNILVTCQNKSAINSVIEFMQIP